MCMKHYFDGNEWRDTVETNNDLILTYCSCQPAPSFHFCRFQPLRLWMQMVKLNLVR